MEIVRVARMFEIVDQGSKKARKPRTFNGLRSKSPDSYLSKAIPDLIALATDLNFNFVLRLLVRLISHKASMATIPAALGLPPPPGALDDVVVDVDGDGDEHSLVE
uniref:Uncharacterized protein n=1 Tax=Romanomermis culicivorax TaxID=13658 RepID=A0A915HFE8_ROMCU